MAQRTLYLLGGALTAGFIVAAGLVIRFGSTLALSLTLALPNAEPWVASFFADPTVEQITINSQGRPLHADLYRPVTPRAALLLVHGLSRAGRRHPDLVRLARSLARHGELVLVPEFEGLTAFRLTGREVEEIRRALDHLAGLHGNAGIVGFSFGAGPALLAAADSPNVRLAASFGGYADLRNVVAFITTGVHDFRATRYVQRQEEYNRWKLLSLLAVYVEHARDRQLLQQLAERKLADPAENTSNLEARLGGAGRSILNLALNRREEAVAPLLAALPVGVREALDSLSPLSRVPRIAGRLLIAHGAGDDSIPFTESLRLAEAASGRSRVVILQTFHHTGPKPFWESIRLRAHDGWNLIRLVDDLLTAR